jgi:hypothetical protein
MKTVFGAFTMYGAGSLVEDIANSYGLIPPDSDGWAYFVPGMIVFAIIKTINDVKFT